MPCKITLNGIEYESPITVDEVQKISKAGTGGLELLSRLFGVKALAVTQAQFKIMEEHLGLNVTSSISQDQYDRIEKLIENQIDNKAKSDFLTRIKNKIKTVAPAVAVLTSTASAPVATAATTPATTSIVMPGVEQDIINKAIDLIENMFYSDDVSSAVDILSNIDSYGDTDGFLADLMAKGVEIPFTIYDEFKDIIDQYFNTKGAKNYTIPFIEGTASAVTKKMVLADRLTIAESIKAALGIAFNPEALIFIDAIADGTLGKYYKKKIIIPTEDGKLDEFVLTHELLHLILDTFISPSDKRKILKAIIDKLGQARLAEIFPDLSNKEVVTTQDYYLMAEELLAYQFSSIPNLLSSKTDATTAALKDHMITALSNIFLLSEKMDQKKDPEKAIDTVILKNQASSVFTTMRIYEPNNRLDHLFNYGISREIELFAAKYATRAIIALEGGFIGSSPKSLANTMNDITLALSNQPSIEDIEANGEKNILNRAVVVQQATTEIPTETEAPANTEEAGPSKSLKDQLLSEIESQSKVDKVPANIKALAQLSKIADVIYSQDPSKRILLTKSVTIGFTSALYPNIKDQDKLFDLINAWSIKLAEKVLEDFVGGKIDAIKAVEKISDQRALALVERAMGKDKYTKIAIQAYRALLTYRPADLTTSGNVIFPNEALSIIRNLFSKTKNGEFVINRFIKNELPYVKDILSIYESENDTTSHTKERSTYDPSELINAEMMAMFYFASVGKRNKNNDLDITFLEGDINEYVRTFFSRMNNFSGLKMAEVISDIEENRYPQWTKVYTGRDPRNPGKTVSKPLYWFMINTLPSSMKIVSDLIMSRLNASFYSDGSGYMKPNYVVSDIVISSTEGEVTSYFYHYKINNQFYKRAISKEQSIVIREMMKNNKLSAEEYWKTRDNIINNSVEFTDPPKGSLNLYHSSSLSPQALEAYPDNLYIANLLGSADLRNMMPAVILGSIESMTQIRYLAFSKTSGGTVAIDDLKNPEMLKHTEKLMEISRDGNKKLPERNRLQLEYAASMFKGKHKDMSLFIDNIKAKGRVVELPQLPDDPIERSIAIIETLRSIYPIKQKKNTQEDQEAFSVDSFIADFFYNDSLAQKESSTNSKGKSVTHNTLVQSNKYFDYFKYSTAFNLYLLKGSVFNKGNTSSSSKEALEYKKDYDELTPEEQREIDAAAFFSSTSPKLRGMGFVQRRTSYIGINGINGVAITKITLSSMNDNIQLWRDNIIKSQEFRQYLKHKNIEYSSDTLSSILDEQLEFFSQSAIDDTKGEIKLSGKTLNKDEKEAYRSFLKLDNFFGYMISVNLGVPREAFKNGTTNFKRTRLLSTPGYIAPFINSERPSFTHYNVGDNNVDLGSQFTVTKDGVINSYEELSVSDKESLDENADSVDIADGQIYALPEFQEQATYYTGIAQGASIKSIFINQDKENNLRTRFFKHSITVLTDDMVKNNPVLIAMRTFMRSNGYMTLGDSTSIKSASKTGAINIYFSEMYTNMNHDKILDESKIDYDVKLSAQIRFMLADLANNDNDVSQMEFKEMLSIAIREAFDNYIDKQAVGTFYSEALKMALKGEDITILVSKLAKEVSANNKTEKEITDRISFLISQAIEDNVRYVKAKIHQSESPEKLHVIRHLEEGGVIGYGNIARQLGEEVFKATINLRLYGSKLVQISDDGFYVYTVIRDGVKTELPYNELNDLEKKAISDLYNKKDEEGNPVPFDSVYKEVRQDIFNANSNGLNYQVNDGLVGIRRLAFNKLNEDNEYVTEAYVPQAIYDMYIKSLGNDPKAREKGMRIVANRTPASGKHSVLVILPVGSSGANNRIAIPADALKVMGIDFDIDSLYTAMEDISLKNGIMTFTEQAEGVKIDRDQDGQLPISRMTVLLSGRPIENINTIKARAQNFKAMFQNIEMDVTERKLYHETLDYFHKLMMNEITKHMASSFAQSRNLSEHNAQISFEKIIGTDEKELSTEAIALKKESYEADDFTDISARDLLSILDERFLSKTGITNEFKGDIAIGKEGMAVSNTKQTDYLGGLNVSGLGISAMAIGYASLMHYKTGLAAKAKAKRNSSAESATDKPERIALKIGGSNLDLFPSVVFGYAKAKSLKKENIENVIRQYLNAMLDDASKMTSPIMGVSKERFGYNVAMIALGFNLQMIAAFNHSVNMEKYLKDKSKEKNVKAGFTQAILDSPSKLLNHFLDTGNYNDFTLLMKKLEMISGNLNRVQSAVSMTKNALTIEPASSALTEANPDIRAAQFVQQRLALISKSSNLILPYTNIALKLSHEIVGVSLLASTDPSITTSPLVIDKAANYSINNIASPLSKANEAHTVLDKELINAFIKDPILNKALVYSQSKFPKTSVTYFYDAKLAEEYDKDAKNAITKTSIYEFYKKNARNYPYLFFSVFEESKGALNIPGTLNEETNAILLDNSSSELNRLMLDFYNDKYKTNETTKFFEEVKSFFSILSTDQTLAPYLPIETMKAVNKIIALRKSDAETATRELLGPYIKPADPIIEAPVITKEELLPTDESKKLKEDETQKDENLLPEGQTGENGLPLEADRGNKVDDLIFESDAYFSTIPVNRSAETIKQLIKDQRFHIYIRSALNSAENIKNKYWNVSRLPYEQSPLSALQDSHTTAIGYILSGPRSLKESFNRYITGVDELNTSKDVASKITVLDLSTYKHLYDFTHKGHVISILDNTISLLVNKDGKSSSVTIQKANGKIVIENEYNKMMMKLRLGSITNDEAVDIIVKNYTEAFASKTQETISYSPNSSC